LRSAWCCRWHERAFDELGVRDLSREICVTIAIFPDSAYPDEETPEPAIAVIDDTHVYAGLGPRLFRVEK